MTCDSRNLITYSFVQNVKKNKLVKPELEIPNSKIGQHIQQPEHEKLKVEKHLRTSDKENFTIFPFLQLHSNETHLRWEYEDYFIKKYKSKLNCLQKENNLKL